MTVRKSEEEKEKEKEKEKAVAPGTERKRSEYMIYFVQRKKSYFKRLRKTQNGAKKSSVREDPLAGSSERRRIFPALIYQHY